MLDGVSLQEWRCSASTQSKEVSPSQLQACGQKSNQKSLRQAWRRLYSGKGLQESPGQPECCADQSRRAQSAFHLPEASKGRQGFGLQSILLRFPKALPERGRRHHGSLPQLGRRCPHQAGGSSRARRSASDWRARSLAMAWSCVCVEGGGGARVWGVRVVAAVVVWRWVWVMCGFAVQTTIILRTRVVHLVNPVSYKRASAPLQPHHRMTWRGSHDPTAQGS